MMVFGKSSSVPSLTESTNLSSTIARRNSRSPGWWLPSIRVLPRRCTLEPGRRTQQIFVWDNIGPEATNSGFLLWPNIAVTWASSSGVIVAVRIQMGEPLAKWTLVLKMFLRSPGLMSSQWPPRPCLWKSWSSELEQTQCWKWARMKNWAHLVHFVNKQASNVVTPPKASEKFLCLGSCSSLRLTEQDQVLPTENLLPTLWNGLSLVVKPHNLACHWHGQDRTKLVLQLVQEDQSKGHAWGSCVKGFVRQKLDNRPTRTRLLESGNSFLKASAKR